MVTPVRALTDAAISSHLNWRRLASVMLGKMSLFIAILCTATEPTPPAPITNTLFMLAVLLQRFDLLTRALIALPIFVILNMFHDNGARLLVILKQVQDDDIMEEQR